MESSQNRLYEMEASVGKADDVYRVADLDNIDLTKENFKLKTDLQKEDSKQQVEVDYGDQFEDKKPGDVGMASQGSASELNLNQPQAQIGMTPQVSSDPQPISSTNLGGDGKLGGLGGVGLSIKPPISDSIQQQEEPGLHYIPVKTGTTCTHMKNPPIHIKDAGDFEPLYPPQEFILEESLRREAERVAHQESLLNRVVFDAIDPSPYNQQATAPEGEVAPFYIPVSSDDNTLLFESRFESGNLRRAIQVYEYEYDLILKPDYNTRGYTQWYYFKIGNVKAGKQYRFNIINLMKPDSLYNHGMRPLVYSETEAKRTGRGWTRGGGDICYYQNSMKRKNAGYYYTLTWSITFEHDSDVVYMAHSYPYTFTDLQRYLDKLEADPKRKNRMRRKPLCQTIAGNNCDMLIVTTFQSEPEAIKARKGIVISSRVHPGETGASWMMKGIIDYLTGPFLNAKILRDNFVFKIIPMLNVDGVVNGSSRCNLAGVDLNRCWIDPSRKLHPTVYHMKSMIRKFQEDRDIFLVCDLHGHSRKKNIFMYGNSGRVNDRLKERIFPCLMDKNCDVFNFADCSFAVQKAKESTARVAIWKEIGITNTFTLEASFCGADQGKFADYHFNLDLLQEVGHRFCDTLLDFCDPDQIKVKQVLEELEIMLPKASDSDSDEESGDGETDSGDGNDGDKPTKKGKAGAKGKKGDKSTGGGNAKGPSNQFL